MSPLASWARPCGGWSNRFSPPFPFAKNHGGRSWLRCGRTAFGQCGLLAVGYEIDDFGWENPTINLFPSKTAILGDIFLFPFGGICYVFPWRVVEFPEPRLSRCNSETCGKRLIDLSLLMWRHACLCFTGWWFQTFFIFTPTWGNDSIWLIFFNRVETTN